MGLDLRRYLRLLRVARRVGTRIKSAEYSTLSGVFPLHFPALDIELDATPEQLSTMLRSTEAAWTRMGAECPHYSVITEEEFRPGRALGEFWTSGEAEAETAAYLLQQIGFGDLTAKTCVEYGCGVGRVTVPFAGKFAEVDAYDISRNHLALASERAQAAGAPNIRFHHQTGGTLVPLASCDFFYSRLVFQHNPPLVIRELIRAALASLRPGGVAIFGVPVYVSGYRFRVSGYLARPVTPPMEFHCIPQRAIFVLIAEAGCRLIELREERTVDWEAEVLGNIFVIGRPDATESSR